MGLFFEVRFVFVALGRSREIGSRLQSQSPWVFLLIPTIMKGLCAPLNGRPLSLASVFSPGFCSGIELESLRSNKKGDTQKQDFAIPDQEPRIFDGSYPADAIDQHRGRFVTSFLQPTNRVSLTPVVPIRAFFAQFDSDGLTLTATASSGTLLSSRLREARRVRKSVPSAIRDELRS
jgi:hypothetical protein